MPNSLEGPLPRYAKSHGTSSLANSLRLRDKIERQQGAPVGELGLNEKFDYFGNAQDRAFGAAALAVDAKPYQAKHRAN